MNKRIGATLLCVISVLHSTLLSNNPSSTTVNAQSLLVEQVDQQPRQMKAGIITTLGSTVFEDYWSIIMENFEESMADLRLNDSTQHFEVGFMTVALAVQNQRVSMFKMDPKKSSIQVKKGDNDESFIEINLRNMSLVFDLDFNMLSRPQVIADKGNGTIQVLNFDVSIHLQPYNEDGSLQFTFKDAIIDVDDYHVDFKGTSEFSEAVKLVLNKFKDFFKNEIVNILSRKMIKTTEVMLNLFMKQDETLLPVANSNVLMNATLTDNPTISETFLSIPVDGSFVGADSLSGHKDLDSFLPEYNDDGKQV